MIRVAGGSLILAPSFFVRALRASDSASARARLKSQGATQPLAPSQAPHMCSKSFLFLLTHCFVQFPLPTRERGRVMYGTTTKCDE